MYTPRNLMAGTSEEAVICSMGKIRLGSSELKLLLSIKITILISFGGIELEKSINLVLAGCKDSLCERKK